MNHLVITGQLFECSALRYTPSGVAVLEFKLLHDEPIEQLGIIRQVKCEIAVVALGDLAMMWKNVTLGQSLKVDGFLAAAKKGSPRMILNATAISVSVENSD